jgi:hypothetical protein
VVELQVPCTAPGTVGSDAVLTGPLPVVLRQNPFTKLLRLTVGIDVEYETNVTIIDPPPDGESHPWAATETLAPVPEAFNKLLSTLLTVET